MKSQTKKGKMMMRREWHLLDAEGQILGRLATRIASLLQGKAKPGFLPYLDQGDWVVVVNAGRIEVSGRKRRQKVYYRYTGYPGGVKTEELDEVLKKNPAWVLERAVRGMLPKNKLGRAMLKRLKVFPGSKHPYLERFKKMQAKPVSVLKNK